MNKFEEEILAILSAVEPFARAAAHAVKVEEAVDAANLREKGLTPLYCYGGYAATHSAQSNVSWHDWSELEKSTRAMLKRLDETRERLLKSEQQDD